MMEKLSAVDEPKLTTNMSLDIKAGRVETLTPEQDTIWPRTGN